MGIAKQTMDVINNAYKYSKKAMTPSKSVVNSLDSAKNVISQGKMNKDYKMIGSGMKDIGMAVKNYMTQGTAGQIATRAGVIGAGYIGASGAIRYASGGSIGRTSSGEKDIAGIPFI
jgi:uncharacterized protein YcfJ